MVFAMGDVAVCATQALVGLMMEEDKDILLACWTALGAVINSIPKELQPSYVRTMREAVQVHFILPHTAALCANMAAQAAVWIGYAGGKAPEAI